MVKKLATCLLLAACMGGAIEQQAAAQNTLVVLNNFDKGAGSLRDAIKRGQPDFTTIDHILHSTR